MGQRKTTEKFIQDAKLKHGNGYDYSQVIYIDCLTGVILSCNICNYQFKITPHAHLSKKQGCPKCSKEKQISILAKYSGTFGKDTTAFIQEAKEKHKDKFDYSLVEYKNLETDVLIKCNVCFNIFPQTPQGHLRCDNCPVCIGRKKDTKLFIEQATKKHKNKYDYSKVNYINSSTKVIIICNNCKLEFPQQPTIHLNSGSGCPRCARELVGKFNTKTTEQFVKEAIEVHKDKYDYSVSKYIHSEIEIDIFCKKCNEIFKQRPHTHLAGSGCQKCGIDRVIDANKYELQDFIDKAINVHNYDYNYSFVNYINNNTPVDIQCNNCNRVFQQYPVGHLQGRGCSNCAFTRYKMENEWLDALSIPIEYRTKIVKINDKIFKFDAYNPITNTVYEFNGDFWHGNPIKFDPAKQNPKNGKTFGFLYEKTIKRTKMIKSAGYNIIQIWESDWLAQKKTLVKNAK